MPSNPRSPDAFTVSVTNGVGRSALFLMTRSRPPCSATNRRPSGANSIDVGLASPLARLLSVKLAGNVAAMAGAAARNVLATSNTNQRKECKFFTSSDHVVAEAGGQGPKRGSRVQISSPAGRGGRLRGTAGRPAATHARGRRDG